MKRKLVEKSIYMYRRYIVADAYGKKIKALYYKTLYLYYNKKLEKRW